MLQAMSVLRMAPLRSWFHRSQRCPSCLLLLILISWLPSLAQDAPAPPDAPSTGSAPAAAPSRPFSATTPIPEKRAVSWKKLVPNVLHDQKPIWLFAGKVVEGQHLLPVSSFMLLTSGLVALDPHDAPYFRRTPAFNEFNRVLSGRNTSIGMAAFPVGFYVASLIRKNSYDQQSVLLAGEAVIDCELVTTVAKDIDGRLRPSSIPPTGNFEDTWFADKSAAWRGRGSFPSGHMIAAMSIATTFADRYPHPSWHRWVAFGLAGMVGFSRITTQSHFPSDVFAGAVLGYSIAHFVVLRPH